MNGKYGFGKCQVKGCSEDAVVGLQNRYVCLGHFDQSMKRLGEDLTQATEQASIDFHIHALVKERKQC